MTVISKDHKIVARASIRDWVVLLVLLASCISAGVIAWTSVEGTARAAEAKADKLATELSEFKDKTNAKLEEIKADTAYIRGVIGRGGRTGGQ
jgi:Zn-dependent protease with chaperone function